MSRVPLTIRLVNTRRRGDRDSYNGIMVFSAFDAIRFQLVYVQNGDWL